MHNCVMDTIELLPYSSERMIIVSGFNCDEVKEWLFKEYGKTEAKKLTDIKSFYAAKNEWLEFLEENRGDLDGLDKDGGLLSHGVFMYKKMKAENCKMRMMILKYGFSPNDPENMRTLAHETLHLCQEFLPNFLNRDEEMEAEAYFHSHIMCSVYKLFL